MHTSNHASTHASLNVWMHVLICLLYFLFMMLSFGDWHGCLIVGCTGSCMDWCRGKTKTIEVVLLPGPDLNTLLNPHTDTLLSIGSQGTLWPLTGNETPKISQEPTDYSSCHSLFHVTTTQHKMSLSRFIIFVFHREIPNGWNLIGLSTAMSATYLYCQYMSQEGLLSSFLSFLSFLLSDSLILSLVGQQEKPWSIEKLIKAQKLLFRKTRA